MNVRPDWIAVGIGLGVTAATQAASFRGVGHLGGNISTAEAVSADGVYVVGSSRTSDGFDEAYRWRAGQSLQGLGDLDGSVFFSHARGVSADGSVVVGDGLSDNGQEAFRWTQATGMVGLGDLDGGSFRSIAYDVSADGSVVVGQGRSVGDEAFRWTADSGMVGLGVLPSGGTNTIANAVSDDGSVVVGFAANGGNFQAFRWTQDDGLVGLGTSEDGQVQSVSAHDVTADGTLIVGQGGRLAGGAEAFRWTPDQGVEGLGFLLSFLGTQANAVSADGSVVVGESPGSSPLAVIWRPAQSAHLLKDVLIANYGLSSSLSGWTLTSATGISADGRVVVGNGINPSGHTEGWMAILAARWEGTSAGSWDSPANWAGNTPPRPMEDVLLTPGAGLNVTGPVSTVTIGSLVIGSQTEGVTSLNLVGGTINVTGKTTIRSTGKLTGLSTINSSGGLLNEGEIALSSATGQILGGPLENRGLITGGQIAATLNNAPTGEIRSLTGQSVRFTAAANTNQGQINVLGGLVEFTGTLTNTASGRIAGRGTLIVNGGLINQGDINLSVGITDVFGPVQLVGGPTGGSIIVSGGATATFFDNVVHNGMEFHTSDGSRTVFFGDVSGSGSYTGTGTVQFEGSFSPGSSPDVVHFSGDLVLGHDNILTIEIGGPTPGDEHDQIVVDGLLQAGGTLIIKLIDGFEPDTHTEFNLFQTNQWQGQFDEIALPQLAGNSAVWDTSLLSTNGLLRIVPEPTGLAWVLSCTLPPWAARLRRKI